MVQRQDGRFTLVGITSWTLGGCGQENRPGVKTRISEFKDWIRSIITI